MMLSVQNSGKFLFSFNKNSKIRIPQKYIRYESDDISTSAESLIEKLPTIKISCMNNLNQENSSCTICFMEYEYNTDLKILPCTHFFHESCIRDWFKNHSTFPFCKFRIDKQLIDYLSQ